METPEHRTSAHAATQSCVDAEHHIGSHDVIASSSVRSLVNEEGCEEYAGDEVFLS